MRKVLWGIITVIAMFELIVGACLIEGGCFLYGSLVMLAVIAWLWLTAYVYGR